MSVRKKSLLIVEWEDIESNSGWHDEKDLSKCRTWPCVSVGWRVASEKGTLRIAATRSDENKKVADVTTIPKGCIRNIRRLE